MRGIFARVFFFPHDEDSQIQGRTNISPSAGRYVHSVRFAGPKQSVSQRQGVLYPLSLASENCINCIPGGEISTDCREEPQHARQGSHTTSKCLLGACCEQLRPRRAPVKHTHQQPKARLVRRARSTQERASSSFDTKQAARFTECYRMLLLFSKLGPFFVRHYCLILQRLR